MTQPFGRSLSVPPPSGVEVFDSARVDSPNGPLGVWRDFMSGRLAGFEYHADDRAPFYGKVVSIELGPVRINYVDCSGGRWSRLPGHLVDGRESYNLCTTVDSAYRLSQGQADLVRGPGEFVLVDNARPSECLVEGGGDYQIVVPRAAINTGRGGRDLTAETPIDRRSQPLRLLRAYVQSIFSSSEDLSDPVMSQKIGDHLLDLVVLGLQPGREAAEQAAGRGLRAVRLAAILGEINKRFCDPEIGPQAIAAALGISPSYLYQLLEERDLVFSRLVLDLRLKRAFRLLSDARHDHLRIAQIAYDCGFNDLSYFNRCFRAQFGGTPGDLRGGARRRNSRPSATAAG